VRHVPKMTAAYNSSKHSTTDVSLFYAMLGVEPLDSNYDIMAGDKVNGVMLADHMLRMS